MYRACSKLLLPRLHLLLLEHYLYYQYLPRLILLLLEHYLLSIFASSSPAAIGTLFTTNILPPVILLLGRYPPFIINI